MKKICANGHSFEKSSDCPVCPVCEKARKRNAVFPKMGAPALRALANAGITGPDGLKKWNEAEILALHGMGPKAMQALKIFMKQKKIAFSPKAL